MRFAKIISAVVFAATLAACATAGSGQIDWNKARQVKAGMTTKEVTSLMGQPYSITTKGNRRIYVWVYVNGWTGSSQSAMLSFDDDKVVQAFDVPEHFK